MDTDPTTRSELTELRDALRAFAAARDWEQFHSPKNLAMALAAEVGELVEPFRWLTETESAAPDARTLEAVREEMADVLIFLVRLADRLDVDLADAVRAKMARNETRYPVELARGRATKHDRL
ncbi:MAG: nucleotide pyrophosphohydrolase [Ectothiorhodospiraceae bacterium]|nr:nucleotide pyrophosphohydrolase [Ectothiorhodospiraceae bacterium]